MPNLPLPLLFLAVATPFTAAADSSSSSHSSGGGGIPSIAVIVVILVLVYSLIGFISVCLRRLDASTPENYASRRFIVAASLWRSHGRLGLDPSVIESFPVFSYSEVKDFWIGNGGSLECAICINEFVDGEMLRKLPNCNHAFHPGCIDTWLASHANCPVCRKDQTPVPNGDGSINYEPKFGSEAPGLQNQVSITVNSDENGTERSGGIVNNEVKTMMKFSRSNSTGHSDELTEQYTSNLNFPVRLAARLKRTKSSGDVEKSKRWAQVQRCLFRTGSIQDADSGKTSSHGMPV